MLMGYADDVKYIYISVLVVTLLIVLSSYDVYILT